MHIYPIKIIYPSFAQMQEQAGVLSVFKRAELGVGAPVQDFAKALHMPWDPQDVDKPMQATDWGTCLTYIHIVSLLTHVWLLAFETTAYVGIV